MIARMRMTVTRVDPIDESSAIVWLRGSKPGTEIRLTVRDQLSVAHFMVGDVMAVDFTQQEAK